MFLTFVDVLNSWSGVYGDMAAGDGASAGSSKRLTIAFIGAKSVGKTSIIRVSFRPIFITHPLEKFPISSNRSIPADGKNSLQSPVLIHIAARISDLWSTPKKRVDT